MEETVSALPVKFKRTVTINSISWDLAFKISRSNNFVQYFLDFIVTTSCEDEKLIRNRQSARNVLRDLRNPIEEIITELFNKGYGKEIGHIVEPNIKFIGEYLQKNKLMVEGLIRLFVKDTTYTKTLARLREVLS